MLLFFLRLLSVLAVLAVLVIFYLLYFFYWYIIFFLFFAVIFYCKKEKKIDISIKKYKRVLISVLLLLSLFSTNSFYSFVSLFNELFLCFCIYVQRTLFIAYKVNFFFLFLFFYLSFYLILIFSLFAFPLLSLFSSSFLYLMDWEKK